jgi:ribose transport system permease protein
MSEALRALRGRPWGLATAAAIVLLVANIVARSSFAAWGSWPANLATFAPFALAAMASTPQILSGGGGIDVSVSPLLNLVSVLLVAVLLPHGLGSAIVAIPIVCALGLGVGALNGVMVTVLRYQPVLATLCTVFVLEGVGLKLLAAPRSGSTGWLNHLGDRIGPVPGALVLIAAAALVWYALGRIPYRRALLAVGGDDAAAYAAGVDVTAVRIVAYATGGLFAALGGIALVAATQSGDPTQGIQYALPAIAAVAIGGTSLRGGLGGLGGSLAGAAIIYLIQALLDSLGVSNAWLQLAYGLLLILAIVLSSEVLAPRAGRRAAA